MGKESVEGKSDLLTHSLIHGVGKGALFIHCPYEFSFRRKFIMLWGLVTLLFHGGTCKLDSSFSSWW